MMCRYDCINKNGNIEPWTGRFKTVEELDAWYNKYGKKHEKNGIKLVRVCPDKNK